MAFIDKPYLIAVDWGTSSFRARLVSRRGEILDSISNNEGILNARPHFETVLFKYITRLNGYTKALPVVLSGMIGSKNGWYEADYLPLPLDQSRLAEKIIKIPDQENGQILLIPGGHKTGEFSDVMRGEETEIIGAIALLQLSNASIIVTGTHSKVVSIQAGKLVDFTTFLTGEMFAALCQASILGAFSGEVACESIWFRKGVDIGFNTKHAGDLLNRIFLARSNVLCAELPDKYSRTFLSGILIGAEIGASAYLNDNVFVMGNGKLPRAYMSALQHLGYLAQLVPDNTVVFGTLAIFEKYKELQNEK